MKEVRLDEKSARRIAAGRLETLKDRIRTGLAGIRPREKPDTRARLLVQHFQKGYGDWLLWSGRSGRNLVMQLAHPSQPAGWVDIAIVILNLRSNALKIGQIARLSAHATARLLERRRGVDIERLLVEELSEKPLRALTDAAVGHQKVEFELPTVNGAFRFDVDEDGGLVAVTWVANKPS